MSNPVYRWSIEEDRPQGIPKRIFREMTREAHRSTLKRWHRSMLGKHFRPGNATRYGLRRRNRRYQEQKRRSNAAKGGRVPLVFTGRMELLLKRKQVVKAFPTRAKLDMPAPQYVSMRPKGNRPNLGEEATRIAPSEEPTLDDWYETSVTKSINRYRKHKVKKL